jgi:hypothetical protein
MPTPIIASHLTGGQVLCPIDQDDEKLSSFFEKVAEYCKVRVVATGISLRRRAESNVYRCADVQCLAIRPKVEPWDASSRGPSVVYRSAPTPMPSVARFGPLAVESLTASSSKIGNRRHRCGCWRIYRRTARLGRSSGRESTCECICAYRRTLSSLSSAAKSMYWKRMLTVSVR